MISSNHRSATANPAPVAQELERELSPNSKAGPFLPPTFSNSVWSPMGAIPKKHLQPPKWRIINDLSWPAGQSVNDAFSKELYTCSYDSIDQPISPYGPSLCLTVLRVLVISLTCYFRLVTGVRRRYFVNLLTVCDTRWRSMEPLWNYPPCFGHVALPP